MTNCYLQITSIGILHGKCHKLIFPWCKGFKYQYTIMKESTQISSYKYFYGKNFTNVSSVDKVFSNTSYINYWTRFQKNYSDCSMEIQKTLCADLFPPCFPDEGTSLYSVCHKTCLDMRRRCPRIAEHSTFMGNFFNSCEAWASGNSDHGFCKHSSWPKPLLWLNYFRGKHVLTLFIILVTSSRQICYVTSLENRPRYRYVFVKDLGIYNIGIIVCSI